MTIRNTLKWSAALSIVFSLLIIASVILASVQINKAVERARSADAVVRYIFDLNALTDEYVAHPHPRILTQWNSTHDRIDQLLREQVMNTSESQSLLESLRERSATIELTFGSRAASDDSLVPILTERQIAQLKTNSQEMVVDATRLATLNFNEQESSRKRIVIILIILSLLFSLSIVVVLLIVYQRVNQPLSKLINGTNRVASGDFRFSLHMNTRDEFGQVAHAFDAMTNRLEEMYANLHKKVWAAEEVVSAQKDFIAMLSHELRNPLAVLLHTVEIMQHEWKDNETIATRVAVMHRNITAMRKLIDDLLEVSRVMRDQITLKKEKIDLQDIVKDVVISARSTASLKMQKIEFAELHPLPILADPFRMAQVITNVIDNAIKFTPEKGKIEVRAYHNDFHAIISVKDNGIGIRKEDLTHIFEAFVQTDEAKRQQEGRGLGLGLKIVKTLVELHGGEVAVHSEGEGRGTTFTIKIPLVQRGKGNWRR